MNEDLQVWNNISNYWQNFHIWVKYPFKEKILSVQCCYCYLKENTIKMFSLTVKKAIR